MGVTGPARGRRSEVAGTAAGSPQASSAMAEGECLVEAVAVGIVAWACLG